MLLASDLAASEMFSRVRKGALPHPTSMTFDRQRWIDAMNELADKTPRDFALATSALHYGLQIASLRHSQGAKLTEGLSRSGGLRLLAAAANQQFLTLSRKMKRAGKGRNRKDPVHFEQLDQAPIVNTGGQAMKGDDHATTLVDTLPHWLHHIMGIVDGGSCATAIEPEQFAGRALMIASIERSLRDLWQQDLWEGHFLAQHDGVTTHRPAEHATTERWFAWEQRQQSLLNQEMYLDLGAHMMSGGRLPPAPKVLDRTVTGTFRAGKGPRRFKLRAVSGRDPIDRVRASEHDALERLYTGLFLDEPLPKLADGKLTCRLLNKAWWLIADLVRCLADEAGSPWFQDDKGVDTFSFGIGKDELERILVNGLNIAADQAAAIIAFLTIDPTHNTWLFGRGFWPTPLLPDPASDRLYLIAAPLLIGSPLRRIEAWLERGGLTDQAGIKGRGKPYEAHARAEIIEALAHNGRLPDHKVAPHALKRKGNSEEIDLLVRIGSVLLVGEVKCFVFPSDPIERYNYMKNVEHAIRQAGTKAAWVDKNRDEVAPLVGVTDSSSAAALTILPLVVTNHGFGLGLSVEGVVVTDLHYLRLVMSTGEYQGDTRFERGRGMVYQAVTLYADQPDFEARAATLFADPPPLNRYQGKITWKKVPFLTHDNSPFELELPVLSGMPMNSASLAGLEALAGA